MKYTRLHQRHPVSLPHLAHSSRYVLLKGLPNLYLTRSPASLCIKA